jgi:hypothetical protein
MTRSRFCLTPWPTRRDGPRLGGGSCRRTISETMTCAVGSLTPGCCAAGAPRHKKGSSPRSPTRRCRPTRLQGTDLAQVTDRAGSACPASSFQARSWRGSDHAPRDQTVRSCRRVEVAARHILHVHRISKDERYGAIASRGNVPDRLLVHTCRPHSGVSTATNMQPVRQRQQSGCRRVERANLGLLRAWRPGGDPATTAPLRTSRLVQRG